MQSINGQQNSRSGPVANPPVPEKNVGCADRAGILGDGAAARTSQVAILTGGGDRPYALGLAATLISLGIAFDFIASDELDHPELHRSPLVNLINLRKEMRSDVSAVRKVARVLLYYWRLLFYAASAKPKLFHILWNNKFAVLDRTLLMLYYRALGKRIVLTAHNVNAAPTRRQRQLRERAHLEDTIRLSRSHFRSYRNR